MLVPSAKLRTPASRLENAFCKAWGIRYPILLAPMGAVAGGALADAVSRAGGLGLIGPGYHDANWIEQQFALSTGARVGVGFITWDLAKDPDKLHAALAHHPFAVMLSFGNAAPFIEPIRRAGARVILQVQTLEAAREALSFDPDLIVAQGTEAGGHGSDRPLGALLPEVLDLAGRIPVVAAGGIADGRGLARALMRGASGALIGTRFFATHEALGSDGAKRRIVESRAGATIRTRVFDLVRRIDWPVEFTGRAIGNDFSARWHGRESELDAHLDVEHERYQAAARTADLASLVVWAGTGLDAIDAIEPAADVLARMVREAELELK